MTGANPTEQTGEQVTFKDLSGLMSEAQKAAYTAATAQVDLDAARANVAATKARLDAEMTAARAAVTQADTALTEARIEFDNTIKLLAAHVDVKAVKASILNFAQECVKVTGGQKTRRGRKPGSGKTEQSQQQPVQTQPQQPQTLQPAAPAQETVTQEVAPQSEAAASGQPNLATIANAAAAKKPEPQYFNPGTAGQDGVASLDAA